MKEKVYSTNNEDFYELETVMDSLLEDYQPGDKVEIYEGKAMHYAHSDMLSIGSLIEQMQEQAYDAAPEYSDDYLEDFTDEQKSQLKGLILKFLDENIAKPRFYQVVDVNPITVVVEE